MIYSSISIQGNIITSEILEKIRIDDIRFQKNTDFGLAPNATLRDEINMAWTLAQSNWQAFKTKRDALKDTDTGTTETRRYWVMPLLSILGYDVSLQLAQTINEKSYAISHGASNKEFFPIHIIGCNQNMDTRPDAGATRLSAHALTQEYLNNIEHLYALVSNGKFLRLLRDATRLSRLSYLEFNLEQMMEEGLYVEFALLYRTLHATRMPVGMQAGPESIIEFYHQEAIASGSRIRERLSQAVEVSIQDMANGLLQHPQNHKLVTAINDGTITAQDFYLYNLRLVYRLLFLLVIEERKLIYPEQLDQDAQQKRDIYYNYYSLQRLAKLCDKQLYIDPNKNDLWLSVLTTFALFEDQKYGTPLGIAPLGAGIFAPDALGIISGLQLSNQHLLNVLKRLVSFETKNHTTVRVNYADLDVEEFGSVYEGLLEYAPQITDTIGQLHFGFVQGTGRSSSGSHYTPEELVKPLIKHSLDYLIADKLKEPNPEAALLSLTVCDVACGSGHILLSAARRIGWELACLRETNANKNKEKVEQPSPTYLRQAIRDAIRHCIYGVDLNPLAVELCKVALWLEAHAPGEPLNFLDHHIKCGNAIVGLAHKTELENGIATEAFKALPGDDKDIAQTFTKQNKKEKIEFKDGAYSQTLFAPEIAAEITEVLQKFNVFKNLPEATPADIANKKMQYSKYQSSVQKVRLQQLADAQVAQFFIPKTTATKDVLLTDKEYREFLRNVHKGLGPIQSNKLAYADAQIAQRKKFFHWFIEYPEVMEAGGFDCI
jgi:hypothetical protein